MDGRQRTSYVGVQHGMGRRIPLPTHYHVVEFPHRDSLVDGQVLPVYCLRQWAASPSNMCLGCLSYCRWPVLGQWPGPSLGRWLHDWVRRVRVATTMINRWSATTRMFNGHGERPSSLGMSQTSAKHISKASKSQSSQS